MLFEIFMFVGIPAATDLSVQAPTCDDGSSPYDENGRPKVDCELDGCTVIEPMCWSERLDYCYDVDGTENGKCALRDKECDSGLSCFGLYLSCVGEWHCEDSHWWGCGAGSCTESAS